jgi:hypothetical protein
MFVRAGDEYHFGKTGRVQGPQGFGYEDDDVVVHFDGGGQGYYKEHQLEKVSAREGQ